MRERTAKCGTISGYRYCKCDECRAAYATYRRETRDPEKHRRTMSRSRQLKKARA